MEMGFRLSAEENVNKTPVQRKNTGMRFCRRTDRLLSEKSAVRSGRRSCGHAQRCRQKTAREIREVMEGLLKTGERRIFSEGPAHEVADFTAEKRRTRALMESCTPGDSVALSPVKTTHVTWRYGGVMTPEQTSHRLRIFKAIQYMMKQGKMTGFPVHFCRRHRKVAG